MPMASPTYCSPHSDNLTPPAQTAIMRDDEKDYQTANNLRAWREHRELSQTELAKRIDTTQAVISLLEKGDRQLSTKWLYRLAPALGISPGFLVDYDPRTLDTSTLELIETASAISKEDRPTAIKVLKGFLKSA